MKLIRCSILLFVVMSCSTNKLKKIHTPKIRMEVDMIINQLKATDLRLISIDKKKREMLDFSTEESEELVKSFLASESGKLGELWNYRNLSTESERLELIHELSAFRKAHLTILKYYEYETKYCDENTIMQKWTLKDEHEKNLLEYKEYIIKVKKNKLFYTKSYKVITRKGSPRKLEIFFDNWNKSIRIDGKGVNISGSQGYEHSVFGIELDQSFMQIIKNCN